MILVPSLLILFRRTSILLCITDVGSRALAVKEFDVDPMAEPDLMFRLECLPRLLVARDARHIPSIQLFNVKAVDHITVVTTVV